MGHRNGLAAGGRNHIDLGVIVLQGALQHLQGEAGRTGGDRAGSGMDSTSGHHTGTSITLGRTHGNTGFQSAAGIQQFCALFGQISCAFACPQHLGKDFPQFPGEAVGSNQRIKLRNSCLIKVYDCIIIGEHAGGLIDAHGILARQQVMDIAGKCCEGSNIFDMIFLVKNCLIQMRNAPALGNIKLEQLGQFRGSSTGDGVTPGPEGCQLIAVFIKYQVTMHHARNANACHLLKRLAELCLCICLQLRKADPHTFHCVFQPIGPDTVGQIILPTVRTRSDHLMVFINKDTFNTGRTQFNAQNACRKIHNLLLF